MKEIATRESDDVYIRVWTTEQHPRNLFVTYLTPDSATRYQFDIHNEGTGMCAFHVGERTTPPRDVVSLLNETGYIVTNLPNITETDPVVRIDQIADALEWMKENGGLDPGDLRMFAYQRALNVSTVISGSILMMDLIGEDAYKSYLIEVLQQASTQSKTKYEASDLLNMKTHTIEFLQKVLIEMRKSLPIEVQEELVEAYELRLGRTSQSSKKRDTDEVNWKTETSAENTITFEDEAVEQLRKEGWDI